MNAETALAEPRADTPAAASGEDAAAAVTDLYREHAPGLTRLALIMVGDRGTAEDVVQDAFAGPYAAWPRLRDRDRALTYVRSAVLNRSRTALRRRRRPFRAPHQPPVWSAESEAMKVTPGTVEVDHVYIEPRD